MGDLRVAGLELALGLRDAIRSKIIGCDECDETSQESTRILPIKIFLVLVTVNSCCEQTREYHL